MASAIFKSQSITVVSQLCDVHEERCRALKVSVLTWIPIHCLPCIKQLVENFASKIAKILTN